MKVVEMTLAMVYDESRILLGMKKRGFGEGRWNGFGGKVKSGETIEQGLERELTEEVGIKPLDLRKRGIIEFTFEEKPDEKLRVHIFQISRYSGDPRESEEMLPEWFGLDSIPYDKMWPDDPYWIPEMLKGKQIGGYIHFKDKNAILRNGLEFN